MNLLLYHSLFKIFFWLPALYSLSKDIWCNCLDNFLIPVIAIFEGFLNSNFILSLESLRISSSTLLIVFLLISSC